MTKILLKPSRKRWTIGTNPFTWIFLTIFLLGVWYTLALSQPAKANIPDGSVWDELRGSLCLEEIRPGSCSRTGDGLIPILFTIDFTASEPEWKWERFIIVPQEYSSTGPAIWMKPKPRRMDSVFGLTIGQAGLRIPLIDNLDFETRISPDVDWDEKTLDLKSASGTFVLDGENWSLKIGGEYTKETHRLSLGGDHVATDEYEIFNSFTIWW